MERIGGCTLIETALFSKCDVFIAQLFLNVLTWKAVNNIQLKEETVHHPFLMCRKKMLMCASVSTWTSIWKANKQCLPQRKRKENVHHFYANVALC